jgi:D-alanyl-D-alanine carboxypeptidase/D-alanyl-D-alanine-endopeptidase (penicillin-binding protein 4)
VKLGALALAAVSTLVCSAPALAVDRTRGTDVPLPGATGAPWSGAERGALAANLDRELASPVLRGAHVGLYAIDARDGRVLYARAPDDAFQPASTLKLLVGIVALETLRPDQRFRTDAVAGGPVIDGTIDGPLIVRAGGDPFLKTDDLDALATAVAADGIHTIRGGVAFDLSHDEPEGYPSGWAVEDLAYDYAPVIGALSFEENAVHLTVVPGAQAGAPAFVAAPPPIAIDPPSQACTFSTVPVVVPEVTTGTANANDTVDLERTRFGCTRVVGTIPQGTTPDDLAFAVPFPTVFTAIALRDALRRHAIVLGDQPLSASQTYVQTTQPNPYVLWSHLSEPLSDTVADMWQPSDNLVAELLLLELGAAAHGAPGTRANGLAFETAWLRRLGVDTARIALADGSGLSAYDRVTPRALVAILKHDWDGPYRDLVLDDLPLAGVRGTLASSWRGTPAERRVFAKTGTLSRARALAGYVASARHGVIIFAFLVDEWTGDAAAFDTLRGRLMTKLVEG